MIKSLLLSGVVSIAFSAPVFADTAAPAPKAPDKVATTKATTHKAPAKPRKAKVAPKATTKPAAPTTPKEKSTP